MKRHIITLWLLLTAGCSIVQQTEKSEAIIDLNASAQDTIVIIYNHGTRNPRKKEKCNASYNQVPASLKELQNSRLQVFFLCSSATEGSHREQAGNQVYARMYEIEQTVDGLIKQGIKPEHIFLAGHSKGAWASLMLMNQVNSKFNAAILFAPALANRAGEQAYPWWRKEVRPLQIKQMFQAKQIDALIFAYEDDEYNRPQDLKFLTDHYLDSVRIIAYRCEYEYTHNTHLHDCKKDETKSLIIDYILQQIEQWPQ